MEPQTTGEKYNKIAQWWHDQHHSSQYGLPQLERAIRFVTGGGTALDVGCGAGGRFIRRLQAAGFSVTGVDVSTEMLKIARQNHPEAQFQARDIITWKTRKTFDFIVAWDSIFHLPFAQHRPVIGKLCGLLRRNGIILYTFGNAVGEHTDIWHDERFYYSSIGINGNLAELMEKGLSIMHLEIDQYPEKHVYVVARKP